MIEELTEQKIDEVHKYLERDWENNAIILWDLDEEYPEKAKFLVYKEDGVIKGTSVDWEDNPNFSYLQIRADNEVAFSELLSASRTRGKILIVRDEFSSMVRKEYHVPGERLYFTSLKRGNENISIDHEVKLLEEEDFPEIKNLFQEKVENGEINANFLNGILTSIKNTFGRETFMGGYKDGELVSFIRTTFQYPPIAMIENAYTKKEYRREGLAFSTISALIHYLFYEKAFNKLHAYNSETGRKLFVNFGAETIGIYGRFEL